MKKIFKLLSFVVGFLFIFSSCAVHNGYMNNSASLSQANFSYVNTNISGKASTLKFLGIGGLGRRAIVSEAKENMLMKNPLKSNQTLANITINWKMGFYLIVMTNTCTVTADIVEFYLNDEARKIKTSKLKTNKKEENLNTQEINSNKQKFKVGDKVQYKDAFRTIKGIVIKIEGKFYYIKYENSRGIEKTLKTYEEIWIKKIN
ncbi:MAG: hypothetical protein IMY72_05505 [Bacteroidetes bacterium]|nr:hypothetical protein [Bacteroidota bacterium]